MMDVEKKRDELLAILEELDAEIQTLSGRVNCGTKMDGKDGGEK